MRTQQDLRLGEVVMYNSERGFGFVRNSLTLTDSFFHIREQGSLVADYRQGEFGLVMGGYCDCEPEVGDRLIYLNDPGYDRGPRATTWVDERDYRQQLMLLRRRGEEAMGLSEAARLRPLPTPITAAMNGHSEEKIGATI